MKSNVRLIVLLTLSVGYGPVSQAYTKPNTYRPEKTVCVQMTGTECTQFVVIPEAVVFAEQTPFSPHSWVIPKAIDLLRANGFTSEADLAQKYLLPMLEGVTFNDVWGDADLAGGSVLDYYDPDSPTDFGYGCVLEGFVFAPYKNCTNTRTIIRPDGTSFTIAGFDTHPLYGYGNAAEHAQFRYDYAKRIYLGHWGDDARDKMAGWVIDTVFGQDDPFDGRWASGTDGIDQATAPDGTQSRFGTRQSPSTAMANVFLHTNTEVVFPDQFEDALRNIHVSTKEVFDHAPGLLSGGWLDYEFGDADKLEAYEGWDGHDFAVYANWTLDAAGHCNTDADCAAPMVVRVPVNSKAHAFFQLGWAIHLLEDNTTPVHTVNGSIEAFERHNDVESMADAVLRANQPIAVSAGVVKDLLPAPNKIEFMKLYDYPPQPSEGGNCSTGVPDPAAYFRQYWWADTLPQGEGVAHAYTRLAAEMSHLYIPYIECIDTESDHNWPSMGVFTALGLDNAVTATAGLIRQYIEDVDRTAPSVTIYQPAATGYPHNATISLFYSTPTDDESGVQSVTPTLDGKLTIGGHGLKSGQTIDLLTDLALGVHTFTVNAVDNAQNLASPSVTFSIIVTTDSIKDDVAQFLSHGAIKNGGIANSLQAKLAAAAAKQAGGNCTAAANLYRAFINELSAQGDKGIAAAAVSIMIADAQYLISHCP